MRATPPPHTLTSGSDGRKPKGTRSRRALSSLEIGHKVGIWQKKVVAGAAANQPGKFPILNCSSFTFHLYEDLDPAMCPGYLKENMAVAK
jgi:hypothetical protein